MTALQAAASHQTTAIEALRRDHQVLRAELMLFEGLLSLKDHAVIPLRAVTYALGRRLRCHTDREEAVLAAARGEPFTVERKPHHHSPEHQYQRRQLAIVRTLLFEDEHQISDQLVDAALRFIATLRREMAHEEGRLFPLLARRLDAPTDAAVSQELEGVWRRYYPHDGRDALIMREFPRTYATLMQRLTVNEALQLFPTAAEMFQSLDVDPAVDGNYSLSELAWRRGLHLTSLLCALSGIDVAAS